MHIPASIDSQQQKLTYFHQTILCQWKHEFMLFCIKRLFRCFFFSAVKFEHKNPDNLNAFKCRFIGYAAVLCSMHLSSVFAFQLATRTPHSYAALVFSETRSKQSCGCFFFGACIRACASAGGHRFACISL